jgi:deoxyadenosine/deoxycytidine kinase
MPTLSIEGNIGAGKSTLLAALAANAPTMARLTVVPEPVDKWTRCGILGLFYRDPRRWAYAFQSYAFFSRLKAQVEARRAAPFSTVVIERSVWSDRHVFGAQARADGLFTEPAEARPPCTTTGTRGSWTTPSPTPRASTVSSTCARRLARIAGRGRPEEANVPLAYLEALHARHEAWLSATTQTPVLVLEHDVPTDEQLARISAFIISA